MKNWRLVYAGCLFERKTENGKVKSENLCKRVGG